MSRYKGDMKTWEHTGGMHQILGNGEGL